MDKHTLALISIIGSCFDVLGAMYLAYDLLGGQYGPLRTLTRGVTYGLLFGAGYGVVLGPIFGIASGISHGATLAWEYSRASRNAPQPGIWNDIASSGIRGLGFGIGMAYLSGPIFGVAFGLLSTVGQVVGYRIGIRPTLDYRPATRPRLTKRLFWAAVNRMVGYALAGYVSAAIAHQRTHALAFGLKIGLTIGAVTVIATACVPYIEWNSDHVPERSMGIFGVGLILIGFALLSVQYWITLLDIPVR
jgi:hypothetical protein